MTNQTDQTQPTGDQKNNPFDLSTQALAHAELQGSGAIAQGQGTVAVGERGVGVGGNVQDSPIITGNQNIVVYLKRIIQQPLSLVIYQDLGRFLARHYRVLGLSLLLELLPTILFLQYKDRYLISWWVYGGVAALLAIIIWGWHNIFQNRSLGKWPIRSLVLTSSLTLAWLALLGVETWFTLHPSKFSPNQFGIAIALFGEGSDFRATSDGREITSRLYRDLDEAITNSPGLLNKVALARIGVVGEDGEDAQNDGERIGAKLVIWGRVVTQGKNLYIHFRILQAPSLLDNPAFPQIIPITNLVLENTIKLPYEQAIVADTSVSQQSLGIAAFILGLAHFFNREYRLAAEQFQNALGHFGKMPENSASVEQNLGLAYYYLGKSYQMIGDFKQSQAMLEQAAHYEPEDLAVLLAQMYNYRVLGDEPLKNATIKKVIELSYQQPSWAQTQATYDRAIAYEAAQDNDAALQEYQAIINQDPSFFVAYLSAANLLTLQNRLDEAEALYREAEKYAKSDPIRQIWLNLGKGRLYEQSGQISAAEQAYQQAAYSDNHNGVALPYYYLANLYAKAGNNEAAKRSYEKLIEVSDIPAWSHSVFARFLADTHDYKEAVVQYREALRYPSYDNAYLHARLALVYAGADKKDFPDQETRAFAEFKAAVQNPGSNEAYIRGEYGRILAQYGHIEDGISQMELSLKVDSGIAAETKRNLGQLYEQVGKRDKAIEMYQSLLKVCDQLPVHILQFVLNRSEALGIPTSQCATQPSG